MILICQYCKKEFKTSHKNAHYCSRSCRNKSTCIGKSLTHEHKDKIRKSTKGKINVGEKNPHYGKCGDKSPTWGTKRTDEVKSLLSQQRIGKYKLEDNPNWKGGLSFKPYPTSWTNELKTKIRKRDNFICALCNDNGYDVHHVDYNKDNCAEDNLITLCRRCHAKTHHHREYWKKYFKKELVA